MGRNRPTAHFERAARQQMGPARRCVVGDFADGFRRSGHATTRAAVDKAVCAALRVEVLGLLSEQRRSWFYEPVRWGWLKPRETSFVKMASSKGNAAVANRHIVLPHDSASLAVALRAVAAVALSGGLPPSAELVELSAAITLPGAKAQLLHSDISAANWPPAPPRTQPPPPLVTCWLALQDVTAGMGPTVVWPASHIRFRERQEALDRMERSQHGAVLSAGHNWAVDSTSADSFEQRVAAERERRAMVEADKQSTEREQAQFGDPPDAVALTMQAGDIGLMDCRVSHLGSEYPIVGGGAVQPERVLLNATWASAAAGSSCPEEEEEESHGGIEGFTYHIRAQSRWAAGSGGTTAGATGTRSTIQDILG
jgi:hypothetical protein